LRLVKPDNVPPILQGYATGYALRVVGKGVALFVGVSFMMVQVQAAQHVPSWGTAMTFRDAHEQSAAYSGYLNVDWGKASKDFRLVHPPPHHPPPPCPPAPAVGMLSAIDARYYGR
jgi:hypothetical protein